MHNKNKCGYCRKSFTRKGDLKRHTKIHGGNVKLLVWQDGDDAIHVPLNNTRACVRYKAAILAHRERSIPKNSSFFNKYASWLTDAPEKFKVRLRYTHEHDQRKLNLQDNYITYACMFAQAHQMSTNQFKFMHASRVTHINDCWKHFV